MAGEPAAPDPVRSRAIELGAALRRRRVATGLTQEALGERIAYHRSYVSQVETGDQVPAEQFVLQCEHELQAGGELHEIFRALLEEREQHRQQGHAARWNLGAGSQLRVQQALPTTRELKTVEFVAWVAEHSSLSFQEAYSAVAERVGRVQAQPPASRHAAAHRRSRITQEQVAQALVTYYADASTGDPATMFYRAQVGNDLLILSIMVQAGWREVAIGLGTEQEQFEFIVHADDPATGMLSGAALEAALLRLAEVEISDTVMTTRPLYRLLALDIAKHGLQAAVTLADFASYALTIDLLEGELVNALADPPPEGLSGAGPRDLASALPLRSRYLPTTASALAIGNRLCVGGPVALLAAARSGSARGQSESDYVLLIQERSARVLNAVGRLAVVPKSFHEPTVEAGLEMRLSASLERELEEELLGRKDLEGLAAGAFRQVDPFHPDLLSEPMRWLLERRGTDAYRVECTSFGLNMVSGNCEFACLILIDDEEWWTRFGGQVEPNWEMERIRRYSSRDTAGLQAVITDPNWSNEGLFAFLEGLQRLAAVGDSARLALPTIETRHRG